MSGVAHAIGKVFKSVVSVVKKVWKPLAVAAAVYFTGGLAGAWALPGAAAAEGGAALGADALAGVGTDALAAAGGDIGAMATSGIDALGADAAATGGMSAIAGGAGDAAFGGLAASSGADAAGAGGLLGGAASAAPASDGFSMLNGVAGASYGGAPSSTGFGMLDGVRGASYGTPSTASAAGSPSLLSQGWQKAMDAAGWLEKHPTMAMGLLQGAGGILKGIQQADMMNQQYKWAAAHAPYQTSGPVGNPFSGFKYNSLLANQNPQNYQAPLPINNMRMNPYQPTGLSVASPQASQQQIFNPLNPMQQQQMMTSGLMGYGAGAPFIEGPHNESVYGSES